MSLGRKGLISPAAQPPHRAQLWPLMNSPALMEGAWARPHMGGSGLGVGAVLPSPCTTRHPQPCLHPAVQCLHPPAACFAPSSHCLHRSHVMPCTRAAWPRAGCAEHSCVHVCVQGAALPPCTRLHVSPCLHALLLAACMHAHPASQTCLLGANGAPKGCVPHPHSDSWVVLF